ncbi:unnamed protein product, partial [Heterosigma akashiwo]
MGGGGSGAVRPGGPVPAAAAGGQRRPPRVLLLQRLGRPLPQRLALPPGVLHGRGAVGAGRLCEREG